MSTRTIIEINHDYLHDLIAHPEQLSHLIMALRWASPPDVERMLESSTQGLRFLGRRHHSETLKLEVK